MQSARSSGLGASAGDTMTQNRNLAALSAAGVSVWLDDLSRDRVKSGNLQRLVDTRSVVGVTTNPSTFERALTHSRLYAEQVAELTARGIAIDAAVRTVITDDVRAACDVLRPQWEASDGVDGRVSVEVNPLDADNADRTLMEAIQLAKIVNRPNVFIKIPATDAGLRAFTAALARGVSVNVTLIFSAQRYRAVMDAYLAGMEAARCAGLDLSQIHSVASLFVSRVDTEVDMRLERLGTAEALALRGQAGIANARLAYAAYQQVFEAEPRYTALCAAGARVQRLLWASTGVKNAAYPDTMYVTELVAPNTVSTIPAATLEAVADHGVIRGDTVTGKGEQAQEVLDRLSAIGIDLPDVFATLEHDGVSKFAASWLRSLQR
ncbi:transaldolase [Mycobacterium [tuberculosis] TKK-01-0051]|uniref:Transaldolase n=2 Tax=Mycobacterium colombiense TaxID=339268 RepID=A0A051U5P7_9MYCO|nr:transaldolase [Mycobacterium [tuberculosis] TKK-01-0051]